MVDFLLSIVGLASLAGAIYEFYKFVTDITPGGGHMNGWIALVLAGGHNPGGNWAGRLS